jgi:hypothetical protein
MIPPLSLMDNYPAAQFRRLNVERDTGINGCVTSVYSILSKSAILQCVHFAFIHLRHVGSSILENGPRTEAAQADHSYLRHCHLV